jgi:hypothetical protein
VGEAALPRGAARGRRTATGGRARSRSPAKGDDMSFASAKERPSGMDRAAKSVVCGTRTSTLPAVGLQTVPRIRGRKPGRAAPSRHREGGFPGLISPAFSARRRDGLLGLAARPKRSSSSTDSPRKGEADREPADEAGAQSSSRPRTLSSSFRPERPNGPTNHPAAGPFGIRPQSKRLTSSAPCGVQEGPLRSVRTVTACPSTVSFVASPVARVRTCTSSSGGE